MPRFVRLVMMLLLAIALPVQGMAAATMMSCGVGGHDHGAAQFEGHPGHDRGATHVMATADSDTANASSHAGHAHQSNDGKGALGKDTGHKCSACASCCVGVAVPSRSIVFESVKLADHFAPLVARSLPVVVTEGLERPPRAAFA